MDGDDAQPGEDRGALGLGAQKRRPGGLAGVFDQFAGCADGVGDGALEVAVVPAVQRVFVATGGLRRCVCWSGAACAPTRAGTVGGR